MLKGFVELFRWLMQVEVGLVKWMMSHPSAVVGIFFAAIGIGSGLLFIWVSLPGKTRMEYWGE